MDKELEDQIKERFGELPEDIQKAIQSSDTEEVVRQIGEAHQLHVDQMGTLGDEVRLVMLGFADPDAFASTIAEQAHIPAEDAGKIANEVAEKIFVPIRKSMQAFMEERELDDAAAVIAGLPETKTPPEIASLAPSGRPQGGFQSPVQQPPAPSMPTAQTILTQPTATPTPAPAPGSPKPYKADPYREPAE